MKIALAFVLAVGVIASLVADYVWRRWIAERKRDHPEPPGRNPGS